MEVALVTVPYHLGHFSVGMGAGPERLLDAGLADALRERGHAVDVAAVEVEPQSNEVAALFATASRLAEHVAAAVERGAFPLVLSGNCFCALGAVAGLGAEVGVVWFDAHADFNTAELTTSGFQDGMGLAILTGTGWNALRETIRGFRVVPEQNVILVAARDFSPGEQERVEASGLTWVRTGAVREALGPAATELRRRAAGTYLHLDLDVLDPSEGRANEYAAADGLTAGELEAALGAVAGATSVRAASITAYDPAFDPAGTLAEAAVGLAARIIHGVGLAHAEQVTA